MQVYALFHVDTDGYTYSCDILDKVYAKKEDAETELTRLELLHLESVQKNKYMNHRKYYDWVSTHDVLDAPAIYASEGSFPYYIEEIEVL